MKNGISKIIAVILSAVTLISATPVLAASSSIGSISSSTTIGEDTIQNKKTSYETVGLGSTKTEVYLTVAESNFVVSTPTTIVLNGKSDKNGKNIGKYSVKVSGDMAGDNALVVRPDSTSIMLHQKGKNDVSAEIRQEQTEFTYEDLANNKTAAGTITANALSAGSWNSSFNFNIVQKPSVSHIAKTVMGYNASTIDNGAILGTDNKTTFNSATTYDAYVLPIEQMSLKNGDTLICTNLQSNKNFVYTAYFLNQDFKYIKGSNYVWKGQNREIPITEDIKYMYFTVVNQVNVNNEYNKEDIPFEDFILYKNSINSENQIDYISEWAKMIRYDTSLNFNTELWGHNMDADHQKSHKYNGKTMMENLKYFDGYDIDLSTTSDGVVICYYNGNELKAEENTYAALKEKYPELMTFEEMLEYIKINNKKIFVAALTNEQIKLVKRHNAEDRVFYGAYDNMNYSPLNNLYVYCQDSNQYNINEYKKANESNNNFYINTDPYMTGGKGAYFTDEQINELLNAGINVGISFCAKDRLMQFMDFFNNHSEDVIYKVNHILCENESSVQYLKAAMRYVYGYKN